MKSYFSIHASKFILCNLMQDGTMAKNDSILLKNFYLPMDLRKKM